MSWNVGKLIPWYSDVADGWKVQRAKSFLHKEKILNKDRLETQILSLTLRGVVENDPENPEGLVPADYGTYQIFDKDDLVFKLIDLENIRTSRVGHVHRRGIMSSAYARLQPSNSVETRYMFWQFFDLYNRQIFNQLGSGVRSTLTAEDVLNLPMLVPPIAHQKAIADYLDRETARIDALIIKRQRMIELLEIRFVGESTVNILRGTRNTETAQSRTGFYGLVPTDWEETSLRHLGCEVQTGPFGSQLHAEEYVEDGWPIVNPQNLIDGRIFPIASTCVSHEKRQDLSRHILRIGDIVFGRRGEMGRAGLVTELEAGWLCGTGSLRLRLVSKAIVPEYFLLLLQTEAAKAYFQLSSVGSTMENLNSEILLDFPMLVPSATEQREIILRMAELRTKKDQMNTLLKEQVRLLSERRQALITASVTGEFKIAKVAA